MVLGEGGVRRPFGKTRSAPSLGMSLSTLKQRPWGGGVHIPQPKMPKVHMSCVSQPLNTDSHSWWDD